MGGQDEPGGRHLPSAWGRPLPGANPFLPWPWCCGGWWCGYLPTGVCARCRGYRPPLRAGRKRPVASPPLHNSPPGAGWPLAPAAVGGGRSGQCGAPPLSWRPALPILCNKGRRGLIPHARAAPPQPGWGTGGGTGGGSGGRVRRLEGGGGSYRAPAGPTTLHREAQLQGFSGPHPGSFAPPPCGFGVGEGRQRPLVAMTHGAQGGRYDTCNAMMRVAGGRGARPGPQPRAGGPLVRKAAVRWRLRQPTSGASLPERGGAGEWWGGGGTACTFGGGGGLWAGGWVRARGGRGCGELSRRASPCGRPGGGAAGAGQSRPGSPGRSRYRGGRGQRWGSHPAQRGLGEGSRGRPFLEGGEGVLPARGTTGAHLERGGGEGVYRPV